MVKTFVHLISLLVLLSIPYFTHSQYLKISTIKSLPDSERYNTKDSTISYPIFKFKNKLVSDRINKKIKRDFQEFYEARDITDIRSILKEAADQGLTDLDHEILRNDDKIFSFYLSFEGMGAYPSHWENYYCFDAATGHLLTLDSLLSPEMKESFLEMLRHKQMENIDSHKKGLATDLKKGDLDNDTYEFALGEIKDYCWSFYSPAKFKMFSNRIEIVIDCEFPHVIQALSPPSDIPISIQEFKKYAISKYKNL